MQIATKNNFPFTVYSLSEDAITIEFGNRISEALFQKVRDFNRLIIQQPFPGFKTTSPAYATLTLFFDPLAVYRSKELPGVHCFDKVCNYLANLQITNREVVKQVTNKIIIPVYYGGEHGPDLEEVALLHGLTPGQVIKFHCDATYKVYMLGFVPGFAYLGGLPKELEMPRKAAPRKAVPAGSVGIAGMQTAVYPMQTPGGWQIIGRTPLKMFDVDADEPVLLKPGYEVIFKSITALEYNQMMEAIDAN